MSTEKSDVLENQSHGSIVSDVDRSPKTQSQCSEQQEWTINEYANTNAAHILSENQKVHNRAIPYDAAAELIATHNTALAAERQRRENLNQRLTAIHRALDGIGKLEDGPVELIQKLRQRLLSAQAIEKHNNSGYGGDEET